MAKRKFSGFTLIELMIAVVIVGILAAVAYPSYQDHLRKSRRAEGKAGLLKAAQVLERWYTDRNTYGNIPAPPAVPASIDLAPLFGLAAGAPVYSGENPAAPQGFYTLTAAPAPCGALNACFTVTATPNAPFTDPACGNFTLTNTGIRNWTSGTNANFCRW